MASSFGVNTVKLERVGLKSGSIKQLTLPTNPELTEATENSLAVSSGKLQRFAGNWSQVRTKLMDLGPGSQSPIGSNEDDQFFGTTSLINGTEISNSLGLTAGRLNHESLSWLKFRIAGNIIFVPMRPIRHSLHWSNIDDQNLVYGNRTLPIGNHLFRVRLLKGSYSDPSTEPENFFEPWNDTTEWGRTLGRVASTSANGSGEWSNYSAADLDVTSGTAGSSWCQEKENNGSGYVIRGGGNSGVDFFGYRDDAATYRAWRPVLELVQ